MWSVIVEDKQGLGQETVFEFKYVPNLSKTTKADKVRGTMVHRSGIEKRNLRAFIFGSFVISGVVWMAMMILVRISREVANVMDDVLVDLYTCCKTP